jgi:hypothetical protein
MVVTVLWLRANVSSTSLSGNGNAALASCCSKAVTCARSVKNLRWLQASSSPSSWSRDWWASFSTAGSAFASPMDIWGASVDAMGRLGFPLDLPLSSCRFNPQGATEEIEPQGAQIYGARIVTPIITPRLNDRSLPLMFTSLDENAVGFVEVVIGACDS